MSSWREDQVEEFKNKSISSKLKEMGFEENKDFVVIREHEQWQVYDGAGKPASPYLSFGGNHQNPRTGVEESIEQDMSINKSGKYIGIGSNNECYSAKVMGNEEMIVTKNFDIYNKLRKEYGLTEDTIGVPMSNGGHILDDQKRNRFEGMQKHCEWLKEKDNLEKCTAAVQRGDVLTVYEPKSEALSEYRNVFHYKKNEYGSFDRISSMEAAKYFGNRDVVNSTQSIKGAAVNGGQVDLKKRTIDTYKVSQER